MNVLVTGATGFIGRHLVKKLIELKYQVRCLVRKCSDITYLKTLGVDLYTGDLLQIHSLNNILDEIDIVYHIAGIVYSRRVRDFYNGNITATRNLLEVCKNSNVKKFVYVSSIAVYKPPENRTLLTEDSPCEPITVYGRSKLEAEQLVKHYFVKYNLPTVIVRGPIIYGPYEPKILTNFFLKILKKTKIPIVGNGKNYRSLCYVDNFIEGLILVGENSTSTGKVYNISDKIPYTLNEILKTGFEIVGEKINVIYLPMWIGSIFWLISNLIQRLIRIYLIEFYGIKTTMLNLGCDISRIENELGYCPQMSLKEGLRRTFSWIKEGSRYRYG